MYGIPGVTHVSCDEQNSALSAFFSEKSNFRFIPSCFSMAKQNFGFLARYPRNNANTLLRIVSASNPSKIFWCFTSDTRFLEILKMIGDTEKIIELVKVVNGVIIPFETENSGTREARTINPKASAPPKKPNLQITITTGAMIRETPIFVSKCTTSDVKKIKTIDIPPNIAHKKLLISLFFRSEYVA